MKLPRVTGDKVVKSVEESGICGNKNKRKSPLFIS